MHPGEEHVGNAGIGIDRVRQGIVNRLVAAELEAALPRALDELFRRRDHEEQVHGLAESREQVAALLIRIGRETVEAEPVDEQMRHIAGGVLSGHVAIELAVDDLQLFRGERARVLVGVAEGSVVQQLLAPDVGADQGEVAPVDPDIARELLLQQTQRALAGRRRSLGIDDHGPILARQQSVALDHGRAPEQGLDAAADRIAPIRVARQIARKRHDQIPGAPRATMCGEQRREDLRERAISEPLQRLGCAARPPFAFRDVARVPAEIRGPGRHRPSAGLPECEPALYRAGVHRRLGSTHHVGQRGVDRGGDLATRVLEGRGDRAHLGLEIGGQDSLCDPAKIDAEIPDARSVRHCEVRRHADQKFVQRQSFGPKNRQIAQAEAGQSAQLLRGGERRIIVFRPEDRLEFPPFLGYLRLQAGVPCTGRILDGIRCDGAHGLKIPMRPSKCDGFRFAGCRPVVQSRP